MLYPPLLRGNDDHKSNIGSVELRRLMKSNVAVVFGAVSKRERLIIARPTYIFNDADVSCTSFCFFIRGIGGGIEGTCGVCIVVGGGGYPKGAGTAALTALFSGVFGLSGNIPAARREAIKGFSPAAGVGAGVMTGCGGGSWVGGSGT